MIPHERSRLEYLTDLRRAIMSSGLPAADRFLLLRVLDLELLDGEAVASLDDLADACGISAKSASRSLCRLERTDHFWIVRRSPREIGRRIRPQAFGLDPLGARLVPSPHGPASSVRRRTPDTSPPDGGEVVPLADPAPPSGGEPSTHDVAPDDLLDVNSPPIVPPTPSEAHAPILPIGGTLREDDPDDPRGAPGTVEVVDFDTARLRTRQVVGLAYFAARVMPITADDVNERRVTVWIWTAAAEDPGAFDALLVDLVEAWVADPYLEKVRKPWAHLQAQLVELRKRVGSRGGAGAVKATKLEAELERAEADLVDAMSYGRGFEVEEAARHRIADLRRQIRRAS